MPLPALIILKNVDATLSAGREIGRAAQPADVFALVGDLGAGKTQLAKGIAEGVGCRLQVTSPTFTLLHEYHGGRLPIYHFDFYRLDTPAAALDLGLDEYLFGPGICVIEWADRFPKLLPEQTEWISLALGENGDRTMTRSRGS